MRRLITVCIITLITISSISAQNVDKLNSTDSIVWLGLDFSHVKLIGSRADFKNLNQISTYYFSEWNTLFLKENEKYDIKKRYKKKYVENHIETTVKNSLKNDTSNMVILDDYIIPENEIKKIVTNYTGKKYHSDIGLLYIVETLNKLTEQVTVRVIFFDIQTGKILYNQNLAGKVGGFGFRNYWMKGFYEVLISSGKKYRKLVR